MPGSATALPVAGLAHSVPGSGQAGNLLAQVGEPGAAPPLETRPPEDYRGGPGRLSAPVRLWGSQGDPATGVVGIPAGLSRGGATETRSRDRVQPAAGSTGAVPHAVPSLGPREPDRLDAGLPGRWAGQAAGSGGRPGLCPRGGGGAQSQVQVAAPATRVAVAPVAAPLNSSAAASCLPAGPPALPSEAAPRLLFLCESPR